MYYLRSGIFTLIGDLSPCSQKGPLVLPPPLLCSLIFQNFLDRKSRRVVCILKGHKGQFNVHIPPLHVFVLYDLVCIVLHEVLLLKLNWMA